MLAAFWWYLGSTLIGWLCFPITQRIFRRLPGKGYAFSRVTGMLLWGYFHWLFVSLGFLRNTLASQMVILALLVLFSLWTANKTGFHEYYQWVRSNRKLILAVELVFLVSFGVFAVFRSTSPEIIHTEKPMELAFLNGILRSETFPPQDPWLSGYTISYYYFGYVMVAMLARLTGAASTVAYNLAQALWFALIAIGVYGLLADLLATRSQSKETSQSHFLRWALLAPVLLLLVSNAYGFLDSLHSRGVLSAQNTAAEEPSGFWAWLDMEGLDESPEDPLSYIPKEDGVVTWWQASRVVEDVNFSGEPVEVIDEFPNFSFVLGDLHPHLLAYPFALFSVGLAMNFLFTPDMETRLSGQRRLPFNLGRVGLDAGLIGSLAFLNTWDWPIYATLYAAVFLIRRIREKGWRAIRILDFIVFGSGMAVVGFISYLPFFLSFASQAGGILPSVIYSTRGVDLWVMFGPFLLPIGGFLVWENHKLGKGKHLRLAIWVTGLVLVTMAGVSVLLAWAASRLGNLGGLFLWNLGASGESIGRVLWEALRRRLVQPGAWLTLGVILALGLALLFRSGAAAADTSQGKDDSLTHRFVTVLIVLGALLILVPEFLYLLDGFGSRMNTIFKFYFQAWLLWSIAGAYSIAVLWQTYSIKMNKKEGIFLIGLTALSIGIVLVTAIGPTSMVSTSTQSGFGKYLLDWLWAALGIFTLIGMIHRIVRRRWRGLVLILVINGLTAGLIYPALAIPERADGFESPGQWTLDGGWVYRQSNPDLMAAVDWLQTAEDGVLAEAVAPDGGDYSNYGRVSMLTGMQAVLGWRYHEVQWRGGSEEIGTRPEDLKILFETGDWETAKEVIDMYNIRYIYLGNLERATYDVEEQKFSQQLQLVFDQGTVRIYQVISD